MMTHKSEGKVSDLLNPQAVVTNRDRKSFHQFFTFYVISIFLVVVVVLSAALWLLLQQNKLAQARITEQLFPLQSKLLQQTYLLNSSQLIDEISHNANVNEMITLQQTLTLQSKKLSLLKSEYKDRYQQWFTRNNDASNLIIRIGKNDPRYQLLKNKLLIILDSFQGAIKIELNNPRITFEKVALLTKVQNQFSSIATTLKHLDLQTPLAVFESLRNQINEMFIEDYAQQLASQQVDSQSMSDIVRDFIRFEDLILKSALLMKWHKQLQLVADYKRQLSTQQKQLQSMLANFVRHNLGLISAINIDASLVLPREMLLIFSFMLSMVAGLLLLMRGRIKVASQVNKNFISYVIQSPESALITNEKNGFTKRQKKAFYSAESEQLIKEIQQVKASNYSEVEYLAQTEKNKELEAKLVKVNAVAQQLTGELDAIEFNALEKSATQRLLEQQRGNAHLLLAIKQAVLLGHSSITPRISATKENDLYHAYLQGRELIRQLRQASYYRYLQGADTVLVLSDVNIAAQVQAVVLNLPATFCLFKNKVSVSIDEKILVGVNLDAELFSEMFRVFICLILAKETEKKLVLTLQLVDKNNGQQKICFSGQIQCDEKAVQLPQALRGFNDDSEKNSDLGDYFTTLLSYQHGEEVSTQLTEQGYQLSFTLPVAVILNQVEKNYTVLNLPNHELELEETCVKLAAKYIAMPIAVLLAVKEPAQFQRLQQLLQAMGLQVTLVTGELMLQKYWQSGLFAVLMTELTCQPFTTFRVDKTDKASEIRAIYRGVFSLSGGADRIKKSAEYDHWFVGELNSHSNSNELIVAMAPWIKAQGCNRIDTENTPKIKNCRQNDISKMVEQNVEPIEQTLSFDFKRYLKHQGSVELALFMLAEYTNENSELVMELSQSFASEDSQKVNAVIQTLLINSKILAADSLLAHCKQWLKLLASRGLDNTDKEQVSLLSIIKADVASISQHADAIA
ncbi:MAG: hypothetical protein V5789_08430 [Colwellia sp.]